VKASRNTQHAAGSAQILEAHSSESIPATRELFTEYAGAIEVNLCFQSFDRELAELPGRYAPPEGRLLLAMENEQPAGCVGLRKIDDAICEMKRLYVRPPFRRQGLGRKLATEAISAAREKGYEWMRLDTLRSMKEAIALYESLGFLRIAPYYDNPNGCAVFMELRLR
jgi:ribosomal protein S18 acetylase RimI-like enzyme